MSPRPIPPPPSTPRTSRRHPDLQNRPTDERWWTDKQEAIWAATDDWDQQRRIAETEAQTSTDIWAMIRCGGSNGKYRRQLGRVVNTSYGLVLIATDHTFGLRRFDDGFEPDESVPGDLPPMWLRPRPGSKGPVPATLWCPKHDGAFIGVDLQELVKTPLKKPLLLAPKGAGKLQ